MQSQTSLCWHAGHQRLEEWHQTKSSRNIKAKLNEAIGQPDLVGGISACGREIGARRCLRFFPTHIFLCFCDFMIIHVRNSNKWIVTLHGQSSVQSCRIATPSFSWESSTQFLAAVLQAPFVLIPINPGLP